MISTLLNNLLWVQGFYILLATIIIGILGFFYFKPVLYVSIGFFLFSLYFFRNPERVCIPAQSDSSVLICPADGRVVDIQQNLPGEYPQKVSIFLSPFDVHVNWIPTFGTIKQINYKPGAFMMAFLPKSSELNEHNDLLIQHKNGKTLIVRQIAGTIARRICCWAQENQEVAAGEKYGMIRFGSRVDILLPQEVSLEINKNQFVYGGQTILGRWTCHS